MVFEIGKNAFCCPKFAPETNKTNKLCTTNITQRTQVQIVLRIMVDITLMTV